MPFLTHHLRSVIQSWIPNRVFSRFLMTHNAYGENDAGFYLGDCSVQALTDYQVLSRFVDNDIVLLVRSLRHGFSPTPHVFSKTVSSCAKFGLMGLGIQIHAVIVKWGFCSNVYICSALLDMYGKIGYMPNAQKLFDEMPHRNVVTWNSLISGYLQSGCSNIAVELFMEMLRLGIAPTPFSLSGVLVGCSQLGARQLGTQLHGFILKTVFCSNVVVGTELIDMYSKCCNIEDSRLVFDLMEDKNVITWTSMVSGYAHNKQPDEAIVLLREMLNQGLKPNFVTYNCLLSSFSSPGHLDNCKQIHCRVIQEGLETNAYIAVTLVTVYSECGGSLEDFRKICANVEGSDPISWNAVIAGFSNFGIGEEALECFIKMMQAGLGVDFFTFTSILRAVGNISALEEGKQMHSLVYKTGYALNLYVQNGLVSMYANCGAISDSSRVFSIMKEHDIISWNSVLTGCAHHGFGKETIELFERMRKSQVKPDNTTFLAVLTACSHVGLLDKGLEYFKMMRKNIEELPKVEHFATIVDLFGRAGNLYEAEAFIESMPIEPGPSVYKALLSACQVHGNKEIAIRAAKKLLKLYPNDPASYVLLSNVFAKEGYWNDAAVIRSLMFNRGVKKIPGFSWI